LVQSLAADIGEKDTEIPSKAKPLRKDARETSSSSNGEPSESSSSNGERNAPEYTAEQVEIVKRIRRTKDYYQILGLEKSCSVEEIKKAYRKISLKVHPDKNKAPGAEEAFKAVSKAFACLSETELRQKYDQYGPEEVHEVARRQQAYRQRRGNGVVYEDMFDADEIFNSFFSGTANGFPRGADVRTFRTGGQQGGARVHTREVHGGLLNLLQFLPVLLLILLSYFPYSKPIYSLEQTAQYDTKYITRDHSVTFFVSSDKFDLDYPVGSRARHNIEHQVERDYAEILKHNCQREMGWKQWNPTIKTPHCDMLRQFYASSTRA
jgi:DnaJ family protein B protein 12